MVEIFVTVDKHQQFKYLIRETTTVRLEYSSSNAAKSCVRRYKIDDYFFKLGYDVFNCVVTFGSSASQQNIV